MVTPEIGKKSINKIHTTICQHKDTAVALMDAMGMPNEPVSLHKHGSWRKAVTFGSEGSQVQQHYTQGPLVQLWHHRPPWLTAETIVG